MTPRFMESGGPTDPMALLMRQRIVFLGTQARRLRRGCRLRARRAPHGSEADAAAPRARRQWRGRRAGVPASDAAQP
jgi:hypothetical protein